MGNVFVEYLPIYESTFKRDYRYVPFCMLYKTCLANVTLTMDSPWPVVDAAPDALSQYAPLPLRLETKILALYQLAGVWVKICELNLAILHIWMRQFREYTPLLIFMHRVHHNSNPKPGFRRSHCKWWRTGPYNLFSGKNYDVMHEY